jgi:hypothetical protein
MILHFQCSNGETFEISNIEGKTNIKEIKEIIENQHNIPIVNQILQYKEKYINEGTLEENNISDEDTIILKLIEIINQTQYCDNCSIEEKTESVNYCTACKKHYCKECLIFSHRGNNSKIHLENSLTKNQKLIPKCENHSKKLEFFCLNCELLICKECYLLNEIHYKHDVVKFTEKNQTEYKDLFNKKKEHLKFEKENIKDKIKEFSTIEKNLEERINELTEEKKIISNKISDKNFELQKIYNLELLDEKEYIYFLNNTYLSLFNRKFELDCGMSEMKNLLHSWYGVELLITTFSNKIEIEKIIFRSSEENTYKLFYHIKEKEYKEIAISKVVCEKSIYELYFVNFVIEKNMADQKYILVSLKNISMFVYFNEPAKCSRFDDNLKLDSNNIYNNDKTFFATKYHFCGKIVYKSIF